MVSSHVHTEGTHWPWAFFQSLMNAMTSCPWCPEMFLKEKSSSLFCCYHPCQLQQHLTKHRTTSSVFPLKLVLFPDHLESLNEEQHSCCCCCCCCWVIGLPAAVLPSCCIPLSYSVFISIQQSKWNVSALLLVLRLQIKRQWTVPLWPWPQPPPSCPLPAQQVHPCKKTNIIYC